MPTRDQAGLKSRLYVPLVVVVTQFAMAPTYAQAQDRVIGLLALPTIFSEGACVPFEPRPVALHDQPGGTIVGTIEVDKNWTQHTNGGCDGLEVSVHRGQARRELPTLEKGYEEPAAIVLDVRSGWVKIRLAEGAAWVAPSPQQEFLPLAKLFEDALAATTEGFKGQLRRTPGGEPFGKVLAEFEHVEVQEVRQVGGQYWLRVDVMSHSICDGNINIEPRAIEKGWLPAHDASGEPNVWFFSRGC